VHLLLDGPDSRGEFRREFLGFGSPERVAGSTPFRERRKESPQRPLVSKMGKGLIYLLLGHFPSFP
jgi:hypothetical protein